MTHAWAYGGLVEDGGDRVRVRRCERCGTTDRAPLARQTCPVPDVENENARSKAAFIAEHGREAWYARHYEARARYRSKLAAERQKVSE